jgi:hypothetical protein
VDRLVAILARTKSKDTFVVTVAALGALGTDARDALPDIIENAERLGVLDGVSAPGSSTSAPGQGVLQAVAAIGGGFQGGFISTVSTVRGVPPAPVCVPSCPPCPSLGVPPTVTPPPCPTPPVTPPTVTLPRSVGGPVPPYAEPTGPESQQLGTPAPGGQYKVELKVADPKESPKGADKGNAPTERVPAERPNLPH